MIKETFSIEMINHYFMMNRYEQVIQMVSEALEDDIENELLWYYIGYSNYALNSYEEAEQQLIEALNLGYQPETIYYILGNQYMKTERWQESEEMFLESLRIDPNFAEAHASYALLMSMTGHKKKAKLLIKKAYELNPESPSVLRLKYLLSTNNSDQVLALEQYINSAESEVAKSMHLGLEATYRGNIKEAREHFRQAYLLNPEDQNVLELLEDFELASHPLLTPLRLMHKVGGPAVFWLLGIGGGVLLLLIDLDTIAILWLRIYVIFAIYTWVAEPLVRLLRKIRR